jgi:hypothetical protein
MDLPTLTDIKQAALPSQPASETRGCKHKSRPRIATAALLAIAALLFLFPDTTPGPAIYYPKDVALKATPDDDFDWDVCILCYSISCMLIAADSAK